MTTDITLTTDRLMLQPLTEHDSKFILALVNTEGWLKFIGNRNVNNEEEAVAYIQKILANTTTIYWTVRHTRTHEPLGVVTLIQRDYLDHPDIGFAFLPMAWGNGYAFEAVQAVMSHLSRHKITPQIFAVILPTNQSSIKLITKLGLQFDREIKVDNEILHVYQAIVST